MNKNSFKQLKDNLAVGNKLKFILSMALMANLFQAVPVHAQNDDSSTQEQAKDAELDVYKLLGTDPESITTTDNSYRVTPNSADNRKKTFFLFNVGTQKFFNIGGVYGSHSTLQHTGMYLWLWDNSKTSGTYNIRTLQNYSSKKPDNTNSYVQYLDDYSDHSGVYIGCEPTDAKRAFGWKFEKANGYNDNNKIYKISTYGNRYLTATPDNAEGNHCEAISDTPSNKDYQVWKLITVEEYYKLFDESPSDLSAPVDASFVLQDPGFKFSETDAGGWEPFGSGAKDHTRFGVEGYYKIPTETNYKGDLIKNKDYLRENGKYFSADIKNIHQAGIVQQVVVSKPGWYIIRCNGLTNTNGLAKLFISNAAKFYYLDSIAAATPLNPLDADGPKDLLEAGKRFYQGEYENQVMMHVSQADLDNNVFEKGKEYIEFGIKIEGDKNVTPTNEWTAFDNFHMLYAGDSDNPNLVLDEDNPDLRYLTETNAEYKNTTLHLHRTFTLNKWNTIILPVNLTYGQMKRTFGDEVRLAELKTLTTHSVQFWTVDCQHDKEIMLKAFTPYIIKPTKEAGENSSYTTPRLMKADNQYWLGENEGITYPEEGVTRYTGGKVTINGKHYDISGITLDKSLLTSQLDNHWVSTITQYTDGKDMVCKGTMAKTYYAKNNKGYFYQDDNESRDDLAGDYFMKNGEMWKVPSNQQYGLKGFRCWFRLTDNTDKAITNQSAPSKEVAVWIDGIRESGTTGIDDIIIDGPENQTSSYKANQKAVYNLNGQLVRQGLSTEGLPAGIYMVAGKKVMVR